MAYLMKCGHVANAKDANGKPICVICAGIRKDYDVIKKICEKNEGLEGREAKCTDCGYKTDSNWDLPFFKYNPDYKYDFYFCGCRGWD